MILTVESINQTCEQFGFQVRHCAMLKNKLEKVEVFQTTSSERYQGSMSIQVWLDWWNDKFHGGDEPDYMMAVRASIKEDNPKKYQWQGDTRLCFSIPIMIEEMAPDDLMERIEYALYGTNDLPKRLRNPKDKEQIVWCLRWWDGICDEAMGPTLFQYSKKFAPGERVIVRGGRNKMKYYYICSYRRNNAQHRLMNEKGVMCSYSSVLKYATGVNYDS